MITQLCAATHISPLWWNWYTQQVEGLCPIGHLRSSRSRGTKRAADRIILSAVLYFMLRKPGGKSACRHSYFSLYTALNENRCLGTPVEPMENSGSHLNRSIADWLSLRNVSYILFVTFQLLEGRAWRSPALPAPSLGNT